MKKYKLTTNLGLKIMAFVFSVFLWLIVVNIDNPVSNTTFNNIPVTIVNDDIIKSSGEVYQVVGEQTVSVVVSATREVRQRLSADDIIATADIKEMDTSTGLVPIKISIPDYRYESAEAVKLLAEEIEKLPEGYRDVLVLRCLEGLSAEQTADMLGMNVNTVNIRLTRARKLLKQKLNEGTAITDIK